MGVRSFAAVIFTGFRKGELCGLRKDDVDLVRWLVMARRSYVRPFPKSKRQRVVAIPEEFVPFITYALRTTKGPWLFPDDDGAMRNKTWQPEDVLRRALKRAGIVTGYTHVCRLKTCRFSEDREDVEIRPCPRCGFKLWPKGDVREIRFQDLRHTYASVLLMLGARLASVQKLLGHSDPKITERRYGHLLPDFMKLEVDRLRFGIDQVAPTAGAPLDSAALRAATLGANGGEGTDGSSRFDRLVASGSDSPDFAGAGAVPGIPMISAPDSEKDRGRDPCVSARDPGLRGGGV